MYDIQRLKTEIQTELPTFTVEITSDLFNNTKYNNPAITVVRLDVPAIQGGDEEDLSRDSYSQLGNLMVGINRVVLRTPIARLHTEFFALQQVIQHFLPVPENENFGSYVLRVGYAHAIVDDIVTYYMEWQYSFPRVV